MAALLYLKDPYVTHGIPYSGALFVPRRLPLMDPSRAPALTFEAVDFQLTRPGTAESERGFGGLGFGI